MKKFLTIAVSAGAMLPMLALAQNTGNITTLINTFQQWVATLIPIVFSIALLVFFWGMVKYIFSGGEEEARKEGRGLMIYGIIALAVMASVYGLISFLQSTLGIQQQNVIQLPQAPK